MTKLEKGEQDNKITTQQGEMGNIQSSLDYFLKFNIPKDAKILDVGCNFGSLIHNFYSLGYTNVYGIEINKEAVDKGKTFYPELSEKLSVHNPGNIPFDSDSFDVVLMFDVIEHVPEVEKFLKNEVKRVLKAEGLFLFQTPNKIINIPWEIIHRKSLTKWKEYHCSLQTLISLKKMLAKADFSSISVKKGNILTRYNKDKVSKKLGVIGLSLLYVLQSFPLIAYPNFWGVCKK
jgi:2-polyprenyl-3-methyl-5-hydroxy-6-metoxy-1,4-benzoquinol methylase